MKKGFLILGAFVLVIGLLPFVYAEGAINSTKINITIGTSSDCNEPVIYKDHTARLWQPNDQTIYTASEYGTVVDRDGKGFYDEKGNSITGYEVPLRQDYVFTGETMKYFIIIEDKDGASTIDDVRLVLNMTNPVTLLPQAGLEVGRCAEMKNFNGNTDAFISDNGDTISTYDPSTMQAYVCTLIVQPWTEKYDVGFRVRTTEKCAGTADVVNSTQSDWLNFNPTLSVGIDGTITFGKATPGSTSLSNTVYVENRAEANSGVVMDMYIASSDYFTDPSNPTAICGDGNGIKYDRFGYYATKGSMNSGANNNMYPGLGEAAVGLCEAGQDEFTPLPSQSGEISDMCRIINHDEQASLLSQGARMSLTFKLDVPDTCEGTFTNGQFYILGRVV